MIRNILFDFGGVIVDVDYNAPANYLLQHGFESFLGAYSQMNQLPFFDDFETGKISEDAFFEELSLFTEHKISKLHLKEAWNSLVGEIPLQRIQFLEALKHQDYKLFMLSNTNTTHIQLLNERIQERFDVPSIKPYFDHVFYSFEIGHRKPNLDAFQYVLNNANIKAEETVFLEDSIMHLQGAQKVGLHTLAIETNKGFQQALTEFLLLN